MKIRKRIITRNAFRNCKGLGLIVPLLLAGPTALATLDLGSATDNVQGIATPLTFAERNWTPSQVSDPDLFTIGRRPPIFRRLPFQRDSSITINDPPVVPEPSSAIAASLLLLPLGASALRIVRKR